MKQLTYLKYAVISIGFILAAILFLNEEQTPTEELLLTSDPSWEKAYEETAAPSKAAEDQEISKEELRAMIREILAEPEFSGGAAGPSLAPALPETAAPAQAAQESAAPEAALPPASQEIAAPDQTSASAETASGLVNLNTADKEELMTLTGIGEARAEAILQYREDYGPFAHIEEIMNISGIKEKAFEKIKDYITV